MKRTIHREKTWIAVLVVILLLMNYLIPLQVRAAGTTSSTDPYKVEITADPEGPYLAGSRVTFTVKVTNLSNDDIDKKNIQLIPSISNQSISDDNTSVLQAISPNDNLKKKGGTWSTSFTITLNAGLKSLNDVKFKAQLRIAGKNNSMTTVTEEQSFDVKALEGILMLSGRDLGSSFAAGGQFHVSWSYKNYDTDTTKYSYKLLLDGKEIPADKIHWETAPAGTLEAKKAESVDVKIDNDVFPAGKTSCVISMVIKDQKGTESRSDVTIAKADISKITTMDLDKLYYGSVQNDSTAPFHNAAQLKSLLENSSQTYAQEIWEKYQYDLWDPNFNSRGGCGALDLNTGNKFKDGGLPDYADELLKTKSHAYPKDGNGPFHNSPKATINRVDATLNNDGVLVNRDEEQFTDLEKKAGPDTGDANKDRSYKIELKAKADLKQTKPIALLFQIQTSWQMFDLTHANDRASLVNGQKVNQELLSLYEMKQGFRDFMEWMNEKGNGAVLLGITNFQHAEATYSMISDGSGSNIKRFTNDPKMIEQGLNGWDTFGDCEHIHYANTELKNAMNELKNPGNFVNWVDNEGNSIYDKADIVSVIVGGACETDDLHSDKALLMDVPGSSAGNVKKQYGIRTNKGTIDHISWMDKENQKGKFDSGKYYPGVTTRQQFFETLKDVYYEAQGEQKISGVTLEDTVTAEFDVKESEIKAMMGGKDVTKDAKIEIKKDDKGNTKVTCTFNEVTNRSEIKLTIPVTAKEDFVGSNNVKTNTGTPSLSWNIEDNKNFTQEFTDEPTVNVPVRFTVKDGETKTIQTGGSVNLKDLAQEDDGSSIITKDVESWIKKYDQIEGTLTYQWVDADGNPVGDATSAAIDSKHRTPPDIPEYSFTGTDKDIDKTTDYKLRITFDPAPVKESSTNKVTVSKQTEEGAVHIKVTEIKEGSLKICKITDNYQDSLADDEFMIRVKSVGSDTVDTSAVLKHNEKSAVIAVTGETELELSEIVPMEYVYKGLSVGSAEAALQTGNRITVKPGDDVTVYVHNEYQWKPYFHDFSSISNRFKKN